MAGDARAVERDPVGADGQPIPQWGSDVAGQMAASELVAAQGRGHFNNYLLGDEVETVDAPQRPEQFSAEQVAQLSREELLAAHRAGHLDDYAASPNGQPAAGAEL